MKDISLKPLHLSMIHPHLKYGSTIVRGEAIHQGIRDLQLNVGHHIIELHVYTYSKEKGIVFYQSTLSFRRSDKACALRNLNTIQFICTYSISVFIKRI